jgi:hypothetical protein
VSARSELLAKTVDGLIFSAPLVPPVIEGRKTVTRRMSRKWLQRRKGDLLFVKENWRLFWVSPAGARARVLYEAAAAPDDRVISRTFDADPAWSGRELARCGGNRYPGATGPLRPSILLPRVASRCALCLTEEPRAERLHDMTDEEALAEGFSGSDTATPLEQFQNTWLRLHTKPGERWCDGPEVVRIAFERAV